MQLDTFLYEKNLKKNTFPSNLLFSSSFLLFFHAFLYEKNYNKNFSLCFIIFLFFFFHRYLLSLSLLLKLYYDRLFYDRVYYDRCSNSILILTRESFYARKVQKKEREFFSLSVRHETSSRRENPWALEHF